MWLTAMPCKLAPFLAFSWVPFGRRVFFFVPVVVDDESSSPGMSSIPSPSPVKCRKRDWVDSKVRGPDKMARAWLCESLGVHGPMTYTCRVRELESYLPTYLTPRQRHSPPVRRQRGPQALPGAPVQGPAACADSSLAPPPPTTVAPPNYTLEFIVKGREFSLLSWNSMFVGQYKSSWLPYFGICLAFAPSRRIPLIVPCHSLTTTPLFPPCGSAHHSTVTNECALYVGLLPKLTGAVSLSFSLLLSVGPPSPIS